MYETIDKLFTPFHDVFWPPFCDVWKLGLKGGIRFLFVVAVLLCMAQLVWTIWRYIDDADERDAKTLGGNDIRRVISGDLLNIEKLSCFRVRRNDVGEFYTFVVVAFICAGITVALWPFVLVIGTIYGLLKTARGSRRLQKTVKTIMVKLGGKANKNHDHGNRYQRI